jgi:CheY-like chemotaxis protein
LQPTTIIKPFKNSVLFSTLHKMTNRSAPATFTDPRPTATPTAATDDSHHQRIRHSFAISETSRRRSSTNKSSNSAAPPLSDGDELATPPLQTSERSSSLASSILSLPLTTSPFNPVLSPSLSSSPTFSVPTSETTPVKSHSHQQQQKSVDEFLAHTNALLVDDNPVNQKVLARMLGRIGLTCKTAQNGQEACDMIRASDKPVDLVFMDIWMPKMNGLEAATVIRNELSLSPFQPYIIAMTACVMPGDRDKCIQAGK